MEYKAAQPDGVGYSQFKLRLSEWQKVSGRGLSMRQVHHAGETVQVDYAGDTVAVVEDGTVHAAQIFVACLPCSGLIYAEATWTQAVDDWLGTHVRLFAFLGGVPAKVVYDYVPGNIIWLMCPGRLCEQSPRSLWSSWPTSLFQPHIEQEICTHVFCCRALELRLSIPLCLCIGRHDVEKLPVCQTPPLSSVELLRKFILQ